MKANFEIRDECRQHNVKLWELAEEIGVSEATMTRKLRRELPHEQQEHILTVIREIADKKGELRDADNADD